MLRILMLLTGFLLWFLSSRGAAAPLTGADPKPDSALQPPTEIAGIPRDEAAKIHERYSEILRKLPGVVSVALSQDGLVVETVNPSALPAAVEGLPLIPIPPIDPRAGNGIVGATTGPPLQAEEPPPLESPPIAQEPTPPKCPPGAILDPGAGRCRYTNPPPPKPKVELTPPPPGLIVLKPGRIRERANACPSGFEEIQESGWRFCVDPTNPQEIPPMWGPRIAGIPYEEALEIHERHADELMKIPGVTGIGLGLDGIHVSTNNPAVVPSHVEGLPIKIDPSEELAPMGHTFNTPVRPLHGAAAVYFPTTGGGGTLTGVALSQGHPWLIFPTHIIDNCSFPLPCALNNTPLNQCPHYPDAGQPILVQPPSDAGARVGSAQRWSPTIPNQTTLDVAAASMDSDLVEGNGSLMANRQVESDSGATTFLGSWKDPMLGASATMRSSIGPPHNLTLRVDFVNRSVAVRLCGSTPPHSTITNQTLFSTTNGFAFQFGDSGSPIFNEAGDLLGMANWCTVIIDPVTGGRICTDAGGGTNARAIINILKFDQWYGTATTKDQTIGTFNISTAQWRIDNGNGRPNTCSTATTKDNDACFTYGLAGDTPITGDWDGNGSITVGVFRSSNTTFYLRNSNSAGAANITLPTGPFNYQPVTGKWGSSANTKVGVFRSSTKQWYLDDGDFVIEGCPSDTCFTTTWTQTGDKPLAGDWDGNGSVTVGVFRPGNTTFYLSNSTAATSADIIRATGPFPYQPVAGDWTGMPPKTKLGVFLPSAGTWYLDEGNLSFPGCAEDQCPGPFGGSNDRSAALGVSVVKANSARMILLKNTTLLMSREHS